MHTFEISNEFLLDGEPFTILSGSIHYTRVHPTDWHHSLYNLKAMGFNTVETYVPWNMHEPEPGVFDFAGIKDLARCLSAPCASVRTTPPSWHTLRATTIASCPSWWSARLRMVATSS